MLKIDTNDTTFNEKEVAAYIQQQMVDLTPHLREKSALQVRLSKRDQTFHAELTACDDQGEIQTVGVNEDLFDAIKFAKEGLIQYFVELEANLYPELRDEKIKHLSLHGNLYLH